VCLIRKNSQHSAIRVFAIAHSGTGQLITSQDGEHSNCKLGSGPTTQKAITGSCTYYSTAIIPKHKMNIASWKDGTKPPQIQYKNEVIPPFGILLRSKRSKETRSEFLFQVSNMWCQNSALIVMSKWMCNNTAALLFMRHVILKYNQQCYGQFFSIWNWTIYCLYAAGIILVFVSRIYFVIRNFNQILKWQLEITSKA
jgi:hypothetical protein